MTESRHINRLRKTGLLTCLAIAVASSTALSQEKDFDAYPEQVTNYLKRIYDPSCVGHDYEANHVISDKRCLYNVELGCGVDRKRHIAWSPPVARRPYPFVDVATITGEV